jgi:hypothetical protein
MEQVELVQFWNEVLKFVVGIYMGVLIPVGVVFIVWWNSER